MAQNAFTVTCVKLRSFNSEYLLEIWIHPVEPTKIITIRYGCICYCRNKEEGWKHFDIDPINRNSPYYCNIGGYKGRYEYNAKTQACKQEDDSLENAIFRFTMQDVTNGCRPIRMECKLTNGIGKQGDIKEVEQ